MKKRGYLKWNYEEKRPQTQELLHLGLVNLIALVNNEGKPLIITIF